jgi:hypothetical protein
VVVLAVLFLGGSPAAAATELVLSPASGPPGTTFAITGSGFAPGAVVKLHWGSQSGVELASGIGPDFFTTAVVPESPPNSFPVVAVVTQGTAVSTSTASFQVTAAGAAPTTTTTVEVTTTTVAAPAPAAATTEPPASGRAGSGVSRDTSGAAGGTGDGVDGKPDTTGGTGAGAPAGANAAGSPTVTSPAGAATPESSTVPTLAPPAGAQSPAPGSSAVEQTASANPGGGDAAAGQTPRSTSQSAGAVSNPALLGLGLALVFGGGVFLAVRNRQRF